LPVSFETAENLILFVNYDIELTPEAKETGTLEWSILRGEKELEAGSTSLLDEEDDWNGFETVSSSPFFTMEEIADTESAYYQMVALAPKEAVGDETYDYYIRAAYYQDTEEGKCEDFYAASTIPFTPQKDADADGITEDASDPEEFPSDSASEDTSVSENSAADDTLSGNNLTEDDTLSTDMSGIEDPSENTDSENTVAEQAVEPVFTLSENSIAGKEGSELPPLEAEPSGKLVLYKGAGTEDENILTEKDQITIASGDTQQITVKAVSEMTQAAFLWESSNDTVAKVTADENGTATITAFAEGYAQITVSCRGITASVVIDVVLDAKNPDHDKLLDLSGDIRVAGFVKESDDLVYNGQKITQNLRVYHKNTLLYEKTDYTLNYKNNVNAAAWNSAKAPSVTINLKGQYQGSVTLYYTIKPLDINNIDIYNPDVTVPGEDGNTVKKTPGYEQAVNYSKNLTIPSPALTFGKKKLVANKDFICDYSTLPEAYKKGDSYTPGVPYEYTVNGTGNFTGSFQMQLVVLKDKTRNFSSASVKLDKKQYEYHGTPLSNVLIEEVKISSQILDKTLYDYEVYATGTEGAYLMLSPSAAGKDVGYSGCKKISLKLVGDRQLKDAVAGADWKETIPFSQKTVDKDGGMFQTGSALLAFSEGSEKKTLTEGTDYTVKYGNAKKAGKVTATFTGKGRYTGSLRLTYTITENTDIKIFPGKNVTGKNGIYEVPYQKGGAVPELILKDQDYTILKNKTDYTIKYKNNKTPGSSMTCEITGKGNYKGYEKTVTLMVAKADIGNCFISIPDKPYSDNPDKWKSTVTITDLNGKKLSAKTDYDANFTFSHTQEQSPPSNTTVSVTVTGIGCYEKTIIGTYRIFDKNISTLKVVIDPQEYTGEEIKLEKSDIHIYATASDLKNKKELPEKDSCFEILESEYKNNTQAGTAKVTLRGIGEYGGTKTYSFKIQKKKYLINHVKGITLDKSSLSLPLVEQDAKKKTLTATITSESNEKITNPTVIWTSSNSGIVAIEEKPDSDVTGSADGKQTVSTSVVLTLKKEGSVTITAASQDGNKKTQCKITVIDAPVLLEADQTIKENIGSTYQLHIEFAPTQDKSKLKWESNNSDAVSVDQDGLLTMKRAGAAIISAVYTSSNGKFTQQCYAVAIGENETPPEPETGALLTYKQQEGVTDDTPYINKMLRNFEWGDDTHEREVTLYLPAGVYHIDATAGGYDSLGNYKFGGIVLTTNQKLVMSPSALLIALPNSKGNYQVINISGRDGVSVSGGQIIGERKEHKGSGGEWGHGIAVFGSTNVTIENVDISQCWGDGIYLGFYDGPDTYSDTITIKNCNLHHNRRNNLSITDVRNVTVKDCSFNYANGADPQYGIDIEPNKNRTCSNVTISNCSFKGNAKGTIQILGQLNAHVKGVTIENCTGDKAPVIWEGFGGSVSGVTQKGNKWCPICMTKKERTKRPAPSLYLMICYASAFASATAFALAATSFSCTSLGACSYLANSYLYVPRPPVMERRSVQ
ncbi:MAG: Ig-like domain-containing protein, partial [Lachnospiraceae bacterium]|nr:Ig-like domain-containing protein [Lachnospiraceae bacterium]